MPVRPQSPYAATKVAGEALLGAYAHSLGLDTVSLRYFNIFGPRQNANSAYAAVIAAFAKAYLASPPTPPIIYGDGTQTRDFTFVHNAVHANLLAARHPAPLRGEILNVGTGGQISVNALAALMAELFGASLGTPFPRLAPHHAPERAGDLKHSFADLTKIRETLGYAPMADFRGALQATCDWYASVLGTQIS
jgi:nucleoside-diphosphate-sugar epimerase